MEFMEEKIPKYMNPYTDFGFKRLFGIEANKDLLTDFLNQLLPPEHQILELNFRNPENLPHLPFLRKAIFDIHCKGINKENFIIEMQKEKLEFFKDRSLFSITFPIQEQAEKGKDWNFKLLPIYFIAILDFKYDEAEEKKKFERHVQLKDQDGEVFYSKLHFKFLQMPLFTKMESELKTRYDKWCYFLKNLENFDHIPDILNEPIFEKAFHISEIGAMNRKEYDDYQESLLSYWETKGIVETARAEGKVEGEQIGYQKGEQIGFQKGVQEIALKAIRNGLSDEVIQQVTGLSLEEIQKLRILEK